VSTENAETLLIEAKHEYDKGNYPSALFNAVAAKATVDVELLTRDLDIDELNNRVSAVEESAVFSINDAEKNGAVPIIAISYYEYAKNLENVNDKFLYFVYAKYFARVSKSLLKVMNESYEYEKKTIDIEIIPSNNKVMYCNIYYTLIGVLFGFIISIVIIKITGRKHKKLRKIKKVHARKRSRK
jgi:predicted S18 family serine protease